MNSTLAMQTIAVLGDDVFENIKRLEPIDSYQRFVTELNSCESKWELLSLLKVKEDIPITVCRGTSSLFLLRS